jgi:class 3 adenylate cyclase
LALGAIKLIADAALWAAIGAMLILFGLQFPHPAKLDSLWLIQRLHAWAGPMLVAVGSVFDWAWPSNGISPLPVVTGFLVLAAKQGWDALVQWLTGLVRRKLPLPDETESLSSSASSMGISVSSTLLALAVVSDKARLKIERRRDRVARLLEESKRRQCAFLSIDVVDPVEMKQGADPEKVAHSFNAYEEMLDEIFRLTSAWKEAWTTDGVMVCYLDVGHALDAAQRVLVELKAFNSGHNELRQPFRVRCGLNEGEVIIFEDSKLEKVADHVIDVAGHMQKNARPNSLWLSSEVYDRLEQKSGFRPANAQVDGLTVLEWRA